MSLDLRLIVDESNLSLVNPTDSSVYEFETFRLDAEHLMLYHNDAEVPLTPKQVETLLALVEHGGEIVSKDVLMSRLWGNVSVEESNLIQHIHFLRKVLGDTADGRQMIETLRRRGYRFNGKLKEQRSAPPSPGRFRPHLVSSATHGVDERTDEIPRSSNFAQKVFVAVGMLGLTIGFVVTGYFLFGFSYSSTWGKKYFAVVPPKPIDSSNRSDLYENGVADAMINRMNSIDDFVVRPLSATRKYTAVDVDPLAVGKEQKVDYVLVPNYQLAEGKIRVTTQLWNVETGQVEDSYTFQREASGIFAVQDALASQLADRLMLRFGRKASGPVAKSGTENEEAYRLYQLGMAFADMGGSKSRSALENLEKALALDPNYANAWAGLARVVRPGYGRGLQTPEEHQRSVDAIEKALAIDPNLADAYVSRCDVKLFYEYDAEGAEAACRRALELDPGSADAHLTYNMLLNSRARWDEAFVEVKAAMDISPASFRVQRQYANTLYGARRYAEAEEQYKRLIGFNSGDVTIYRRLIRTLEAEGKEAEALQYLTELLPLEGSDDADVQKIKQVYATSGWRGVTYERIKMSASYTRPMEFWRAQWYAYLGDKDKAFQNLEESFQHRSLIMMFLRGESHQFDTLKDDPRFDDLIRRVEGK